MQKSIFQIGISFITAAPASTHHPTAWADVVKKSLDERDFDKNESERVDFYNVADISIDESTPKQIDPYLKKLELYLTVNSTRRLGLMSEPSEPSDTSTTPRIIEVCMTSDFE